MQIKLPESGNKKVDLGAFMALWKTEAESHEPSQRWHKVALPIFATKESFDAVHPGVDRLCRRATAGAYRNTMQATGAFFEQNELLLRKQQKNAVSRHSGRMIDTAILTEESLTYWDSLSQGRQEEWLAWAARIVSAADECGDEGAPASDSDVSVVPHAEVAVSRGGDFALAEALVEQLHREPFQAMYRRQPVGSLLVGWPARYKSYFWPAPGRNNDASALMLLSIQQELRELLAVLAEESTRIDSYLATEECIAKHGQHALSLAERIFDWGGVPQPELDAQAVMCAVRNALAGRRVCRARMNSGWTKLAAFVNEAGARSGHTARQTIWDSRVSTAVVRNIDVATNGGVRIKEDVKQRLRLIPGRGGTRAECQEKLRKQGWQVGWGPDPWATHFEGGAMVSNLVAALNKNVDRYGGMPGAPDGRWSMRGVEMVLFMEGY